VGEDLLKVRIRLGLSVEKAARKIGVRPELLEQWERGASEPLGIDLRRMAEAYGVKKVIYAHCHGQARFHDSLMGRHRGIEYHLVSGDYLKWQPECIEK
jgi:transcriptional regulator with XRE-family HTH domain